MPGRLRAMATASGSTVSRTLDIMEARRIRRRLRKSPGVAPPEAKTQTLYTPMRVAAIGLFVGAVGFLAYGFAQQLRGDTDAVTVHETAVPPAASRASVSPVTLADEARRMAMSAPASTEAVPEPVARVVTRPAESKPRKVASANVRPVVKVEASSTTPIVVVPPAIVAAAPAPVPTTAPAIDRWQSLSAALGRCDGNLFTRIGCEHVARAQFCEGYWGQVAQCPAGVANDHGQ